MLLFVFPMRFLIFFLVFLFSHQSVGQEPVNLSGKSIEFEDSGLWRSLEGTSNGSLLPPWENDTSNTANASIVGHSGVYVTDIPLTSSRTQTWYVVLTANFMDEGDAYWQPENGKLKYIANFSQLDAFSIPKAMHVQSFPLALQANESGRLWIRIKAKHYPTPAPIVIHSAQSFYHYQFIVNTVTSGAVTVMLTLALISLAFGMRTKQSLSILCAGYVGLHGIGWAMAAGLMGSLFGPLPINLAYGGMYLFPLAIAFAALFTRELFDTQEAAPRLAKHLMLFTKVCLGTGVFMLFTPFQWAFYLSHVIAMVWVPLSLYVGFHRLSKRDFRAKYYLVGNLLYGASLFYFLASHTHIIQGLVYPELVVLVALAIDCVCIVLSLSEWLKLRQNEYQQILFEARIDSLTKVGNRFSLDEKLATLDNKKYLVVFIDLDGMKQINDSMGHEAGDTFLIEVANLMKSALGPYGSVYRSGGDEFVWLVVSDEAISTEQSTEIEDIVHQINRKLRVRWPEAGLSYGISTNEEANDQFECLAYADQSMYEHKLSKRQVSQ